MNWRIRPTRPSTRIAPAVGRSSPAMIRSNVDLPIPFAPISAACSPSGTRNDTPSKSVHPPGSATETSVNSIRPMPTPQHTGPAPQRLRLNEALGYRARHRGRGRSVEIRSRRAPGLILQTSDRFDSGRFRPPVRTAEERPSSLVPNARRAVAASILGMFFVAIVSATPNSPFYPVLPTGMEAANPLRWLSGVLGLGHLDITALMLVGLLATVSAAIGFVVLIRECWVGRIPVRTVVILVLAFHAIVLMLPLLFSRDVYSYAFYGRIVSTYRANPYGATPSDFPLNS